MQKNLLLLLSFLFIIYNNSIAQQNTVGVLSFDEEQAYDGYNIHYPHNQPNVYLLDNCGRIVNIWEDEANFSPGNTAYITPEGKLIKAKRTVDSNMDPIWAGGGGETVEIRDWDNNLEWTFTLNDSLRRLHHDIAPMPNGNILMIVWENISGEDAIAAGRDTALLEDNEVWPEYIIEVEPVGTDDFNIVWEWHTWDHLVQDYDATKANFGVIADNPGLANLNYPPDRGRDDWMHANAIDYNPNADLIVISVPTFNELWVIDHSTTTEEAAGHTGGAIGKGGDLVYRWGNPAAYERGDSTDQKLFFQHDTHWMDKSLFPGQTGFGQIMVFNNRAGADFSTVNIITPNFDMYEWDFMFEGDIWAPLDFDWTYMADPPSSLYSTGLSSSQRLPNGNTLICAGRPGYTFEVTPEEEIVWEYRNPLFGGVALSQGDTLPTTSNLNFRVKRYATNYPGFDGKDLSPMGYIELNPDTENCALDVSVLTINKKTFKIFPNPTQDFVKIESAGEKIDYIKIHNATGQALQELHFENTYATYLNMTAFPDGMYYININNQQVEKLLLMK